LACLICLVFWKSLAKMVFSTLFIWILHLSQ
jgi:hypothetical protein